MDGAGGDRRRGKVGPAPTHSSLWWIWAAGDSLSGMRAAKALLYDSSDRCGGPQVFWELRYICDAISAAKAKPAVWLSHGGAPQPYDAFLAASGTHPPDFRPSKKAARRRSSVGPADSNRLQWLHRKFTCSTLYLLNLLLKWSTSLYGRSAPAAGDIFRDFVAKVIGVATASEVATVAGHEYAGIAGIAGSARAERALVACMAEQAISEAQASRIFFQAERRGGGKVLALATVIDSLVISSRSGEARPPALADSTLCGLAGKRRRYDAGAGAPPTHGAGAGSAPAVSAASPRVGFGRRNAVRQTDIRTLDSLAQTIAVLGAERRLSIPMDETTIGDGPTTSICAHSAKRKVGAWLLP